MKYVCLLVHSHSSLESNAYLNQISTHTDVQNDFYLLKFTADSALSVRELTSGIVAASAMNW